MDWEAVMLVVSDMSVYFREALESAMDKGSIHLTEPAQIYLVHLLSEFARSENVFAGTERGEKPTLVELLSRAKDAEPIEAVRVYKHLGDSSLYFSGFFVDSMEREAVGRSYYLSMGETAYSSVADLMRVQAATSSALFTELADRFADLAELLHAVSLHGERTQSREGLPADKVLALLERYRRTGDHKLLEILAEQGVVMRPGLVGEGEDDEGWVN
jgi:hypothetical protein